MIRVMVMVFGILLICGASWFYLFEPSIKGFPVPRTGVVLGKPDGLNIKTRLVSEVDGPGLLYAARIRQAGWKVVDREGLAARYEKDGQMIELTTFDDELFLEPAVQAGIEQ
ncbi:hypothetical protein [Exiguobacterium sp. S22-S28]|uniref:hypothetical protein n=1 Tax=Exiguobacterium sp. S22-S28 TaxID=3342768 RepID=UPI00372D73E9